MSNNNMLKTNSDGPESSEDPPNDKTKDIRNNISIYKRVGIQEIVEEPIHIINPLEESVISGKPFIIEEPKIQQTPTERDYYKSPTYSPEIKYPSQTTANIYLGIDLAQFNNPAKVSIPNIEKEIEESSVEAYSLSKLNPFEEID